MYPWELNRNIWTCMQFTSSEESSSSAKLYYCINSLRIQWAFPYARHCSTHWRYNNWKIQSISSKISYSWRWDDLCKAPAFSSLLLVFLPSYVPSVFTCSQQRVSSTSLHKSMHDYIALKSTCSTSSNHKDVCFFFIRRWYVLNQKVYLKW